MKIRTLLLTLATTLAVSAFAADVKTAAPSNNAAAAFARLKSLAGEWQGDSSMGKIQLTYEVVSNGHVVVEHMNSAKESMITTYYLQGDKLALTHYCGLGNQPHMIARKIDLTGGDIDFDFAGAANLASERDAHMHQVAIHLVDPDHFTTAWTLFENASPKMTVTAQYARVK